MRSRTLKQTERKKVHCTDKYIITRLLYQPLDVITFSYLHYCTAKDSLAALFCQIERTAIYLYAKYIYNHHSVFMRRARFFRRSPRMRASRANCVFDCVACSLSVWCSFQPTETCTEQLIYSHLSLCERVHRQ